MRPLFGSYPSRPFTRGILPSISEIVLVSEAQRVTSAGCFLGECCLMRRIRMQPACRRRDGPGPSTAIANYFSRVDKCEDRFSWPGLAPNAAIEFTQ
jgi:hypothetical protein